MSSIYKFPPKGSLEATLLVDLLGGVKIRNHRSMHTLGTPSAGTIMTHLRNRRRWDDVIERQSVPFKSSSGRMVSIKEYWIEPKTIMELKANDPRIESFLKSNRKS